MTSCNAVMCYSECHSLSNVITSANCGNQKQHLSGYRLGVLSVYTAVNVKLGWQLVSVLVPSIVCVLAGARKRSRSLFMRQPKLGRDPAICLHGSLSWAEKPRFVYTAD